MDIIMSLSSDSLRQLQDDYLLGTYSAKLALVRGEGNYVWDAEGKRYLDFATGISVCNLGHCHPHVTQAIQQQAAKLVHVSNLYINELQPQLAKRLSDYCFNSRAFFCNSGAEANEGLIKFARKWGKDSGRHELICMKHNFHGRTIATLGATDKPAIKKGFGPFPDGFKFVDYNDLAAIDEAIGEETVGILMEVIQGEGGVIPADNDYLKGVREICDKYDILLLFDEVQTGIGRTGSMFAFEQYDVIPDGMSIAKALGNGFPMGAFMIHPDHHEILGKSSHATTFGGTPLACSAAMAVLDIIESENLLANVQKIGTLLSAELERMRTDYELVTAHRGLGLMQGIKVSNHQNDIIQTAQTNGLLLLPAADNVVRIYPALNIDEATLMSGIEILDNVLGDYQ
jgi:acetylornithine/N-succinyldiaminopimelate aminotransferase